ncbi:1,6-anhydro-N-acetylmuramyl-L-alanine amidase AmpD [Rugamonas apoptosis]|uniref:1,6-anhydro-N-acetylmuramyl-L-alanine amidase AmpD n=1 Tax=Rugamonas apoptosis TaxID=2758570 RepID=A0A7W2IL30_9BURK|nr:1,6-anhydro-N-acetylmuramyl-L-alanine amidase AmpD [Rugamonas apoptosis]MBA5688144.1 1,6-anhydro-N-acetylmuramyl-L-alanine amidase AmpD [Rugamonas apoptosis]
MAARFDVGADGWCHDVLRYDSPHADARPDGAAVTLLVVHNISLPAGQFGTPHVSDLFTGRVDYNADPAFADLRGLKVSSHFLVRRDGRVIQYVAGDARAWHAGKSAFQGRTACNDFSIGIELEGTDTVPFETAQYEALAALTLALQERYPLTDVQGHEHIAPGRKTDPGPLFSWQRYIEIWGRLLKEKAAGEGRLVPAYRQLRFPVGVPESQPKN